MDTRIIYLVTRLPEADDALVQSIAATTQHKHRAREGRNKITIWPQLAA